MISRVTQPVFLFHFGPSGPSLRGAGLLDLPQMDTATEFFVENFDTNCCVSGDRFDPFPVQGQRLLRPRFLHRNKRDESSVHMFLASEGAGSTSDDLSISTDFRYPGDHPRVCSRSPRSSPKTQENFCILHLRPRGRHPAAQNPARGPTCVHPLGSCLPRAPCLAAGFSSILTILGMER